MPELPNSSDPFDQLSAHVATLKSARAGQELLGMIAAMVVGPSMTNPRIWLEAAIGDAELTNEDGTRKFADRAMAAYDHCQSQLEASQDVGPPADDETAARQWCRGFFAGSLLDEAWRKDKIAGALLMPIGVISGRVGADARSSFDASAIRDKIPEWRRQLPAYTRRFFEYFEQARAKSAMVMAEQWSDES